MAQIVLALSNSNEPAAQYQQLLLELVSLQKALDHLEKLRWRQSNGDEESRPSVQYPSNEALDSIKFAALACRRPLEAILNKIQKYKKTLGGESGVDDERAGLDDDDREVAKMGFNLKTKMGCAARKIQWEFTMKAEVQRLQSYLNLHVSTINMLLAEYGLETMELESTASRETHDKLRDMIDCTQKSIERVSANLDARTALVERTSNDVEKLLGAVTEWSAPWKAITNMVSAIWEGSLTSTLISYHLTRSSVSTHKMHTVLLDIKESVLDVRWTYFQAPIQVEDALGYKFPVPSEYDFSLLQEITQHRFQDESEVAFLINQGEYELSYATNSTQILSSNARMRPGSQVIMAVILNSEVESKEVCPMPKCPSSEIKSALGGGYKW